jgi:replicative DNA helicase
MNTQVSSKKRFSINSEVLALFTLCHNGTDAANQCASLLLGSLNADHFVSPIGETVYSRIKFVLRNRGDLPDIEDILEDPGLSKDVRRSLKTYRDEGVRGLKQLDRTKKLFNRLDQYRKIRALFEIGINLENKLHADKVDIDSLIEEMAVSLTNASKHTRGMTVASRGDGNSTLTIAKEILRGNGIEYIPTGISAFDKESSGIPRGAYMIIGATTGGGKSTAISQLSENMAMAGARVGVVPLEMNNTEMVMRELARASGVSLTDLAKPRDKMSLKIRKQAYRDYKKRTLEIDKRGGCIKLIEPGGDVDIQTLLAEAKPFDLDVIFIDYIGLLKGAEGDAQWRELQNISRYCKVWGSMTGVTVIMAAQVADEGNIRYSGGITENASYAWVWVKDELSEATNIYKIKQKKSRQSRSFDFYVYIDSAHMTFRDVTKEELTNYHEFAADFKPSNGGGEGIFKRKSSSKKSKEHDYSDEDNESDVQDAPKKKTRVNHGKGKWSPTSKGGSSSKKDSFREQEF